ncbi:transposase [Nostoc sp. XA010]|uniref:transposase n=1 Tax=Nostoc sp. XA010 TaxID=2780407 RepID=UPI001E33FB66|nr:transposase [Nostoc sp. XA010]MCC5657827.1 transposase [Nostoc sp. XA010]
MNPVFYQGCNSFVFSRVKKRLSERTHNCPNCKVSLCRDLNASVNIKARGTHALKAQVMSSLKSL